MSFVELIKNRKAKVTIIGMGYVGLPHAVEIAKVGFSVSGIDVQKKRVNSLNKGVSYIKDVKSGELKKVIKNKKFKAYNTYKSLKKADIVIICVPTPLDDYRIPNLSYIKFSVKEIKKYLHKEQLIILESTTYPGTTEEVILPMLKETGLEVGKDFYLSFAPERIDPGNNMAFSDITKVVGGITKKCTNLTELFYSQFIKNVHPVSSSKIAEMTKLLENIYRLINISAINELALLCGKMQIDIWEVIDAAKTKPYGFQAFYPSSKVGGHCIPLDPFYLSWKAKEYNFWTRFIELAGEINEQMPHYTVTTVNYALNQQGKSIRNSKILIWGVAYKKDIGDSRESASFEIIPDLLKKGAIIDYFDPYIPKISIQKKSASIKNSTERTLELKSIDFSLRSLKKYDCVLILTDHSKFDYEEIAKNARLVIDTKNAIKSRKHKNVFRIGG
ncbi:MAG: nucleotide sugar dehydrogenase [Candidatus Pacebacteria bacterium]|nr:nucleotide sugar dehydrogenase [Candidatus Paceibacterota bacterium]